MTPQETQAKLLADIPNMGKEDLLLTERKILNSELDDKSPFFKDTLFKV